MKNKNSAIVFVLLFLLAVLSRCWAHPWNFTLVGGVFLFAGAYFQDKKISVTLMLLAMLVSDAIIGFHAEMPAVYLGYLAYLGFGFALKPGSPRAKVLLFAFLASASFFLITNFAVWNEGILYPKTQEGLLLSYQMGIPFFRMQFISDLAAALVFFELARVWLRQSEKAAI